MISVFAFSDADDVKWSPFFSPRSLPGAERAGDGRNLSEGALSARMGDSDPGREARRAC